MVGQSIPLSTPVAAIAGFLGGELANYIAKEIGLNNFGQRFAVAIGHATASAAAGYAVNALGGLDATGAVATTGQTALTATIHALCKNTDEELNRPDFNSFVWG
ncbi:MAG: hypothetical protein JNL70_07030 [Saprospiraceae bacterium]|nr:hypothetical protein [Saprospiraceae bacterium]